jgi:hypothetical protein
MANDMLATVAGIATTLINVRAGLGWSKMSFNTPILADNAITSHQPDSLPSYDLRPMAISATRSHIVTRDEEEAVKS